MRLLDYIANLLEIIIASLLLAVIAVKILEMVFGLANLDIIFISMDIKDVLSAGFILVIGIELTKMLIKHTPESIIDVLLFTIARYMVMYHERMLDLLLGVAAIAGLFAIKMFLIDLMANKK